MSQKIDDKYRLYHVKKAEIRMLFLKSIKSINKIKQQRNRKKSQFLKINKI